MVHKGHTRPISNDEAEAPHDGPPYAAESPFGIEGQAHPMAFSEGVRRAYFSAAAR
jgi:hypothetical protein